MADESTRLIKAVNSGTIRTESFKGIDCKGALFPSDLDLSGAQLRYAIFAGATLQSANFDGTNLRHVDFRGANLIACSFVNADVGKAHFGGTKIMGASLLLAQNISQATGINKKALFFPQAELEVVVGDEKPGVRFDGTNLTIPEHPGSWQLEEGYRVVSLIDGNDERGLIGQALTRKDMEKLGAEVYPDTAIFENAGYQLEQGFLGTSEVELGTGDIPADSLSQSSPALLQPSSTRPEQDASPKDSAGTTSDTKEAVTRSDLDLLNEFLTNNLK